jgi:Fcf2 pre-rRNA processing
MPNAPQTESTDDIARGNKDVETTNIMEEIHEQEDVIADESIVAEPSLEAKQKKDDHVIGNFPSKNAMETENSENGDDGGAGAAFSKSSSSKKKRDRGKQTKKQKQQHKNTHAHHAQPGLSNKLTKLLPGYIAPMKLMAPSLDRYRALPARRGEDAPSSASLVAGLDALRRKSVQQDSQTTTRTATGTTNSVQSSMKHHAQVMLQKTTSSSSAPLYVNTHASFKRGAKRPSMNHAGEGWFGMQATPMTAELERDLLLIRNRNYLDPKRFYKSADKKPSKFVQAGTVIEGATEFYSSRLAKRQRRGNLVEEIMAESSSLSNRKQSTGSSSFNNSGGTGTAGNGIGSSSADYVMKKYKSMQQESSSKAQAWHKRNNAKGRRKPQRK